MSPLSTTDLQKTLKINGAICTTAWAGPCSVRLWLDVGQCIYICSLARLQEIFEPQNTIYSLYMICPTDPPQKNQKNPEKNPSKGHPRARTLVEFEEKFPDVFHDMQIKSEPLCSDPCARLKIQISMRSISWGCSKIVRHCDPISLLINTFGIHLEPGCKSNDQIINDRTAKNVHKKTPKK